MLIYGPMSRREVTGLTFMDAIYICMFVCVCVCVCIFPMSLRFNARTLLRVWFTHHLRNEIFRISRVHSLVLRRYSKFLADSDPESVCHKCGNMRDRCASCEIRDLIISSSEPAIICSSFARSSADIWIDANKRCGFSLEGNWLTSVREMLS